jgi:hypothetical protein
MSRLGTLVISLGLAALTGCGGGGGGRPSSMAPPPPQNITFNGASDSVSFTFNAAQLSNTTSNGAQVTVSPDDNGNARFITLNIPTGGGTSFSRTFDLATAVQTDPAGPIPGFITMNLGVLVPSGAPANILILDDTLNFASFGFWQHFDFIDGTGNSSGAMGGIAFGNATPVSGLPNNGSATFTGRTIGGAVDGTTRSLLAGTVSLTANFGQMTMGGTFTVNNVTSGTAVPWGNFTLAPTAIAASAGGPYGGINTLSGTIPGGAITNSSLNGQFFGPAAQETAGTWSVFNSTTHAVGAYGAARP